jgi:uncharacterized protein with HEPN domain
VSSEERLRLLLRQLLEWIGRVERFTADGPEAFYASELIQQGVIRCYEVIGEIVKRLPAELTERHPHIPWHEIAGFRDFLIHRYDRIDVEVVWRAVNEDLADLRTAAEAMLGVVDDDASAGAG